jgi:flagellar protein FlaG
MAIDNIAQLVTTQARPVATPSATPAVPQPAPVKTEAAAGTRQELPLSGQKAPPEDEARDVQEAVDRANQAVQLVQRDLQFRVDEDLDRVIVSVVDTESGEIIRQIPSEEMIQIARSLEKLQEGMLLSQRA